MYMECHDLSYIYSLNEHSLRTCCNLSLVYTTAKEGKLVDVLLTGIQSSDYQESKPGHSDSKQSSSGGFWTPREWDQERLLHSEALLDRAKRDRTQEEHDKGKLPV